MSDQNMDWKDISFKFCPPTVYDKLEAKLLVGVLNGAKLLADTLGAPRGIIDTAGRRNQSSSADILNYLMEDGQTTWRTFYDAVVSHHREDIRTVLDRPDRQKAILDYYKNSWEYARKSKQPKIPTEDDDPMDHLGACGGKDHDETTETARSYLPSPSPRTQPNDISVEAKTVNIFVLGPADSNSNSLTYPSPTSPNGGCPHHGPFRQTPTQTVNSGSLMSGGTWEISTPNQNFKRTISYERENQCKCKKIAADVDDMETEDHAGQNVASGVLPSFCTFLQHGHDAVDHSHQEQNGLDGKLRVKAEQEAPKREFVQHQMAVSHPGYPPCQENGVMNGKYARNVTPSQKEAMQCQTSSGYPVQPGRGEMPRSISAPEPCQCCGETRLPSLGSSVPPNRSQSVVEPLVTGVNMGPPMPKVGSESGGTWPKSGLRSTATNAPQSVSEPRNMQYSEFRRGRLLFLFNAYSQKKACAMGRYFYDQFKIGVKLGYWSLQNDVVDEIGQEIRRDVANSTWIAVCLDRQYLQIIRDFENSRESYRPLPRNKNFNIRYTYALLKSEHQRLGPSARQILLFYTPDVDLRVAPAWLLNASSKTQYKLPVGSDLLLTEKDQDNLYWIFRQVGLLSDHIGQRNDQARLYKRNLCQ